MRNLSFVNFWSAVQERLEHGESLVVALVAAHSKGSPGTPGAKMLIDRHGHQAGTIGGGAMEKRIADEARESLVSGEPAAPRIETLVHRKWGDGHPSGMICAGSQTNIYLTLQPEVDLRPVRRIVRWSERDAGGLIRIDPGGLSTSEQPPDLTRPCVRLAADPDDPSSPWTYEEELLERRRLAVIGGGHCAVALSRTMAALGYRCEIYDTRDDVFTLEGETGADRIEILEDYADAGSRIRFPALTAVIVMTTDYPSDVRSLLGLAGLRFPFIGLMGSATKIARIRDALHEEGADEAFIESLVAPVGLPMDSDTPEEIAISVAAQILQERNLNGRLPR